MLQKDPFTTIHYSTALHSRGTNVARDVCYTYVLDPINGILTTLVTLTNPTYEFAPTRTHVNANHTLHLLIDSKRPYDLIDGQLYFYSTTEPQLPCIDTDHIVTADHSLSEMLDR